MKARIVAWILVGCTGSLTAAGFFVPEAMLATGSIIFGGSAIVVALYAWTQSTKQRISAKLLEQLR